ncbi:MAG: PepSY domain-containing protein [Bryobacterales bacterium]|nr:PepSY domain-containing protein [Bryobacterales bacterium]
MATPRSPWRWRNVLYQAHLWLGLGIGLYLVMLGITGSLLVFGREIDRSLNPHLWRVDARGERKPLSEILAAFDQRYPGASYSYVNYPFTPDGPFVIRIGPASAGQTDVHIDPYSAAILGERTRISSFYGFLCYLHFYLLAGRAGWTANGYGAMLTLILLTTGVWLWWPGRKAGSKVWKGRFSVKAGAGRPRLLYDLHNAAGVYPLIFSVIFALTAMEFAFPDTSKKVVYALTGTPAAEPVRVAVPAGATPLPLDRLVASADSALPGRIRRVSLPSEPGRPLLVRKEWDDWNVTRNHANIAVDPYSGQVLAVQDTREAAAGAKLIQWCIPLHFGLWGGLATRVLYVLLGMVPVVAFVTGFWHWRLRRRREATIAVRKPGSEAGARTQIAPAAMPRSG